jgi:hypothetical protein
MPTLRLLPELEEALRQIAGVRAASVVTGPDAVPTEIHVLATPGKTAKQVVRDVQSLAMARYDIDIDHRIVSVVQIGEDEPSGDVVRADRAQAPDGTRPSITAITVRSSGGLVDVSVTLELDQSSFEGSAEGPSGPSHRARLVAMATLRAVGELLPQPCHVESSTVLPVGARDLVLTVLTMTVLEPDERVLTGCALVRGDEADAVARSVLAALNRQLAG